MIDVGGFTCVTLSPAALDRVIGRLRVAGNPHDLVGQLVDAELYRRRREDEEIALYLESHELPVWREVAQ